MGEETPEPVEIQCPGCESRFRLTPKKGRLPSGDIPCPKCFEEIPVENGEVMTDDADNASEDASDSTPGFGVMSPGPSDSKKSSDSAPSPESSPDNDKSGDEQEAIEHLEKMAQELPSSGSKSTMAGLPGVGRDSSNPFSKSGNRDKTAAVDPELLEKAASDDTDTDTDTKSEPDDSPDKSFANNSPPDTSPRLVEESHAERLAAEDSTAATAPEELPDEDDRNSSGLRETAEQRGAAEQLRDTAENRSISKEMLDRQSKQDSSPSESPSSDDESSDPKQTRKNLLGRVKKKTIRKKMSDVDDDSSSAPSSPFSDSKTTSRAKSLEQLKEKSRAKDGDDDSDGERDRDSSLSNLFQKVRERRGSSDNLRKKLKESKSEDAPTSDGGDSDADFADDVDLSKDELADIVDRNSDSRDDGDDSSPSSTTEEEQSPSLPRPKRPSADPSSSEASIAPDGGGDDEHSGLFDEVGSAAPPKPSTSDGGVEEVSKDTKKTTSQSMLARLKKGNDTGGDDNPLDIGAAGEKRGSGYIRLPTDEIQDVLGQGDFRLKIEGVVYEPVDKDGLIRLIKGGVLLGAEEIAEAGGDWMPISEHPVFGELRRKMAAEAHEVLSRIGSKSRVDDDDGDEDESADAADQLPKASTRPPEMAPETAGGDAPPPEPSTTEMSSAELARMASKSTGVHESVSADDKPSPEKPQQPAPESVEPTPEKPQQPEPKADEPQPASTSTSDVDAVGEPAQSAPPFEQSESSTESRRAEQSGTPSAPVESDDSASPRPDDSPQPADKPRPDSAPARSSGPERTPETSERPSEQGGDFDEPGLQRAEETLYDVQQSKSRTTAYIAGTVLGLAILGIAGALWVTPTGHDILEDTVGWSPADSDEAAEDPEDTAGPDPAIDDAIAQARQRVDNTVRETAAMADDEEWAHFYLDEGDTRRAAEVMSGQYADGHRSRSFLAQFAEVLHDNQDYSRARSIALEGITAHGDEQFFELHRQSVEDDEALLQYQTTELDDPTGYSARQFYNVADHRGIVLEAPDTSHEQLLFKPERDGWTMGWRAEIAAWRFCELVACHFDAHRVEPAVVTREFLDELDGDEQAISETIADASWTVRERDGEDVEVVRGSLEYIPETPEAPFPIEYRPLWRDWLTAGAATDFVDDPAHSRLDALQGLDGGRFYDELVDVAGETSTGELARSVSSLLIFDYLTNNWERFFTRTEDYGKNNPVRGMSMASRHNGDAFQPRASRRVRERFEWTTRFSQSTVETIEALDRDTTYQVLFPEGRTAETRRLDVFWQQRSDMLNRIDELVARHGEDDVLLFP